MTDKKKIKEIHEKAFVFDAHAHPMLHAKRSVENLDLGIDNPNSQIDFIKMKNGGVNAVFYALPLVFDTNENPSKVAIDSLKMIKDAVGKYPDLAEIAYSTEDMYKIVKQGKRAIFLNLEYFDTLEGKIDLLDKYKKLGISSIVLLDEIIIIKSDDIDPEEAELSDFGKNVIKRMNELGILIDISHLNTNLQKKVLNLSKQPVVASHSNVRSICNLPRNIPDDTIKMIAEKNGAIMVTFYPGSINLDYHHARTDAIQQYRDKEKELKEKFGEITPDMNKELEELWNRKRPEAVDYKELIDHIDHIVKLVGSDYVGIGSDYGGTYPPKGLETAAKYQNFTAELLRRGYSEEDIIKILGGNLLRIVKKVLK